MLLVILFPLVIYSFLLVKPKIAKLPLVIRPEFDPTSYSCAAIPNSTFRVF